MQMMNHSYFVGRYTLPYPCKRGRLIFCTDHRDGIPAGAVSIHTIEAKNKKSARKQLILLEAKAITDNFMHTINQITNTFNINQPCGKK